MKGFFISSEKIDGKRRQVIHPNSFATATVNDVNFTNKQRWGVQKALNALTRSFDIHANDQDVWQSKAEQLQLLKQRFKNHSLRRIPLT